MIAVGNPPVNALNGLSLKSLMSVAEPVSIMGTPCACGATPFFVPIKRAFIVQHLRTLLCFLFIELLLEH
jgi:hypothetical protein